MAERLRKFIARAPRYVLRPNDAQFLRFAPDEGSDNIYSTRFLNVSETGLAFIVDRDMAPHLGDVIKIEFPIPGASPVAWFARVVRVEEFEAEGWKPRHRRTDEILIGIHFLDMPEAQRRQIRRGLEEKFLESLRQHRRESVRAFMRFVFGHYGKLFLYALCALATFAFLYYLSQPDGKYDPQRGTQWGDRFKIGF